MNEDSYKGVCMRKIEEASLILRIIGDRTRFQILDYIKDKEYCVKDIAQYIDMTHSAVSHQLRVLKQYDLVTSKKEGKEVYYTLRDQHVYDIINQAIQHVEHN